MELLKQLCDPGLAKQLWKKGVRLDTYFFYFIHQDGPKKGEINYDVNSDLLFNEEKDWLAPTSMELEEILPRIIDHNDKSYCLDLDKSVSNVYFFANYCNKNEINVFKYLFHKRIEADSEVNYRAKLILELIKQKFIKVTPKGDLEPIERVEA